MDNLELLEHLGAVEAPDEAVLLRATAMLEAEIARVSAPVTDDEAPEKSPRSRWHSRVLVGVAMVIVLAAAAVGVTSNLLSGSSSAAASVLRRLARVALVQSPVAVPGPGQYLYMQTDRNIGLQARTRSPLLGHPHPADRPGGARQADLEPQHRKRPSRPCRGLRPGR
jgi:hypothetical protein